MSNKYLEKIALNKVETYLASQPTGRDFSRKSINKAYSNIQFAKANKRIAEMMAEVGAQDSGVVDHFLKYEEGIRRNRSRKFNGAFANNGYKFDELSKNKSPAYRAKKLADYKSSKIGPKLQKRTLLQRVGRMVKKHPIATGATALAGAGLAYGIKKNNEL